MVARLPTFYASLEKRADGVIVAIAGYFLLAVTTIYLTSDGRNHATMWLADAVILALLLRFPKRDWSYILLAGCVSNVLANTVTRGWTPGLLLYGPINMAQTCLAAWLIVRSRRVDNLLADAPTVLRFALCAGIIAPVLGAIAGSAATALNYGEAFGPSFVRWYLSNALGLLIITPFLMAVLDGSYWRCFRARSLASKIEAIGLSACHVVLTMLVFFQNNLPLLFLPLSSVLFLSFRLGRLATILGVMITALIGAAATFKGVGPITAIHAHSDFQEFYFQFYVAIMLTTTLPVAAIVSSRAEVLDNLAEREEALRLMMTNSPDGILSFDVAGVCRWADGPIMTYLGLASEAMVGRSLEMVSLQAPEIVSAMLAAEDAEQGHRGVFEFSPVLRPHLTLEGSIGILRRNGNVVGTVITLRDVTRRKAKEVAILSQVQRDDLTGVLNRSGFSKQLRALVGDEAAPASLALVDVDNFKTINDSYGHAIGDAVLVEIASRMKLATRESDVIGRIGGDEFAILLRCDLDTAQKACERMAESIRNAPVFGDGGFSISASISCGVAEYRPGLSRDQVFDAADAALYEVKRAGRNGVRAAA